MLRALPSPLASAPCGGRAATRQSESKPQRLGLNLPLPHVSSAPVLQIHGRFSLGALSGEKQLPQSGAEARSVRT